MGNAVAGERPVEGVDLIRQVIFFSPVNVEARELSGRHRFAEAVDAG